MGTVNHHNCYLKMTEIVNTRKSVLRSAHDDILFAPPDGSSEWAKEFEWMDVIIYPDGKVALKSYHDRYLSDQLNGSMEQFSDGKICLKGSSGKYVSAQPDGTVSCDKDMVGDWEKFDWLTVYTNPGIKEKSMRGNAYKGHLERSNSISSSSSSVSSSSVSPANRGKHIFRSKTIGLKTAGTPLKFHKV